MKILDRVRWWRESNRYRATKLNPKDRAALDAELRALRHVGIQFEFPIRTVSKVQRK